MNVSSECVDNFHYYKLQPAETVTTNSGMHSYVIYVATKATHIRLLYGKRGGVQP